MRERQVGHIRFILRLDFLKTQNIRLLLLHQRLQYIIDYASLLLTIFNLSRHGSNAIYVKADEFHFLVYCLTIFVENILSIFNTIL